VHPATQAVAIREAPSEEVATTRALREVLSTILSADVVERVLGEALQFWAFDRIPEDEIKLRLFVEGPLRGALDKRMGPDAADLILDDLRSILLDALAEQNARENPSGIRRRTAESNAAERILTIRPFTTLPAPGYAPAAQGGQETIPAPVGGITMVGFVTEDASAPLLVGARLEGLACVALTSSALSLLEAFDGLPYVGRLIVLDCRTPSRLAAAAAGVVLDAAPNGRDGTRILLWGSPRSVAETLTDVGDPPTHWIRCGECTPDEMALMCLALLQ
jgi:hypothetical protein